jgi:hypothetical protein
VRRTLSARSSTNVPYFIGGDQLDLIPAGARKNLERPVRSRISIGETAAKNHPAHADYCRQS